MNPSFEAPHFGNACHAFIHAGTTGSQIGKEKHLPVPLLNILAVYPTLPDPVLVDVLFNALKEASNKHKRLSHTLVEMFASEETDQGQCSSHATEEKTRLTAKHTGQVITVETPARNPGEGQPRQTPQRDRCTLVSRYAGSPSHHGLWEHKPQQMPASPRSLSLM